MIKVWIGMLFLHAMEYFWNANSHIDSWIFIFKNAIMLKLSILVLNDIHVSINLYWNRKVTNDHGDNFGHH